MSDIFRDFARDVFGIIEPPESIPLRILGLTQTRPSREAIISAFRRQVVAVHPDLQHAYNHPQMQPAADAALGDKPEIRELVWAREVLLERAPSPVTDKNGAPVSSFYPSRPPLSAEARIRKCKQCRRALTSSECVLGHGPRRGWCWRCVRDDDRTRAADRRSRRRANKHCAAPGCTVVFTPTRADGRYCSHKCRQAAYRGRVTDKPGTTMNRSLPVTATTAARTT